MYYSLLRIGITYTHLLIKIYYPQPMLKGARHPALNIMPYSYWAAVVLYRHLSSLSASRERRLGNPTAQGVVSRAALSSPKSPLNTFIYLFI